MLRDDLWRIGAPVLRKVSDHPLWSGLRDGSLPGEALTYFVEQDTGYLLPGYGRALARCAAVAAHDAHASLLTRCATATLESAGRLRAAFANLAAELGVPALGERSPVDPATRAQCAFFAATTTGSLPEAIGGLLPMLWFNLHLSRELTSGRSENSRYRPWIEAYDSGPGFERGVEEFLDMVEQIGADCAAADRARLVERFRLGARYEWAFAQCALRRANWR